MKRVETEPGEQILIDCEALIRKTFFFLKSMPLSPASLKAVQCKFIAARGLYLTIKKLNKQNLAKLEALKDTAYVIYLRWNVVDRVQTEVLKLRNDLIRLNVERSQSGLLKRASDKSCEKEVFCAFCCSNL